MVLEMVSGFQYTSKQTNWMFPLFSFIFQVKFLNLNNGSEMQKLLINIAGIVRMSDWMRNLSFNVFNILGFGNLIYICFCNYVKVDGFLYS